MSNRASHLHQNLEALREPLNGIAREIEQAGLEGVRVEESRSGALNLFVGRQALHSRYDPEREARDLAGRILEGSRPPKAVVLIGAGMGYIAEDIRRRDSDLPLIVVEPDVRVARAAMQARDL
ncbi:hypothetical protein GF324_03780, partial [bacterium]|nr:hypothetical protein [bacterium]